MADITRRRKLILTDVGLFLARRRVALGLSGRALGKRIGVSHVTISRGECGVRLPSAGVLDRWSLALGLAAHQIPHLCEDLRYDEALRVRRDAFVAANRAADHARTIILGDLVLDDAETRALTRVLLIFRREVEAKRGA